MNYKLTLTLDKNATSYKNVSLEVKVPKKWIVEDDSFTSKNGWPYDLFFTNIKGIGSSEYTIEQSESSENLIIKYNFPVFGPGDIIEIPFDLITKPNTPKAYEHLISANLINNKDRSEIKNTENVVKYDKYDFKIVSKFDPYDFNGTKIGDIGYKDSEEQTISPSDDNYLIPVELIIGIRYYIPAGKKIIENGQEKTLKEDLYLSKKDSTKGKGLEYFKKVEVDIPLQKGAEYYNSGDDSQERTTYNQASNSAKFIKIDEKGFPIYSFIASNTIEPDITKVLFKYRNFETKDTELTNTINATFTTIDGRDIKRTDTAKTTPNLILKKAIFSNSFVKYSGKKLLNKKNVNDEIKLYKLNFYNQSHFTSPNISSKNLQIKNLEIKDDGFPKELKMTKLIVSSKDTNIDGSSTIFFYDENRDEIKKESINFDLNDENVSGRNIYAVPEGTYSFSFKSDKNNIFKPSAKYQLNIEIYGKLRDPEKYKNLNSNLS
ncbi:MAG: hypothetical protein ACTHWZ_03465 [Peptoniphilaceae bacterium]